ncbi:MAG: secretion protein HlyD, partial [Planctomycetota bacterium]|nr:secretion protein HlyD [Planctomycetota bacterium]
MKFRFPHVPPTLIGWGVATIVVVSAFATRGTWVPTTGDWVRNTISSRRGTAAAHGNEPTVAGEDGNRHDDAESLELSEKALRNLG